MLQNYTNNTVTRALLLEQIQRNEQTQFVARWFDLFILNLAAQCSAHIFTIFDSVDIRSGIHFDRPCVWNTWVNYISVDFSGVRDTSFDSFIKMDNTWKHKNERNAIAVYIFGRSFFFVHLMLSQWSRTSGGASTFNKQNQKRQTDTEYSSK